MQDSKNAGKYAYLNAGIVHKLPEFVGILFKETYKKKNIIIFKNLIVSAFWNIIPDAMFFFFTK